MTTSDDKIADQPSEEKKKGVKDFETTSVRIDRRLMDDVGRVVGDKYGGKAEFVKEAIEREIARRSGGHNVCETCILLTECRMKVNGVRNFCRFRVSHFNSFLCKFCRRWDVENNICSLISDYGYDYRPNESDKCIVTAFDPITIDQRFEKAAHDRRVSTKVNIVLRSPIFKTVESLDPSILGSVDDPDALEGSKKSPDDLEGAVDDDMRRKLADRVKSER